jgi:flagellin
MNSILTNSQALSALMALNMTQQDLNITQNQVATGLAVSTAADNAAYWAIGTQLTSDNGIITAANTALAQSQSILSTATSAINSVITTIDAIQTQVTDASNPGASLSDINSTLASLSAALTQAVNGASFNGVNLLNNTQAALSFVSGYDGTAQGGSVSTIAFAAKALTGGVNAAAAGAATAATTVTDPTLISTLEGLGAGGTIPGTNSATATTYATAGGVVTITSTDTAGDVTIATYTGYTGAVGGTAATVNTAYSASNLTGASSWTVSTQTTTTASPSGLLVQTGTEAVQNSYNLTALGTGAGNTAVTATNASDMLSAVNAGLAAVKSYASAIGEASDQMTTATTFNTALSTDYTNGLSALVDADMNIASTRLQALQTQEQLGIQSLSIANQNSQLILKLFPG